MEKIIFDIKRNWKETPNSVKFWNGLILLGLVVSGILDFQLLGIELMIMSLFTFVLWIGSLGEEGNLDKHLWVWFTPLLWCLVIIGLIIYGCIKLQETTISKFNDWLDKEK